MFLKAFNFQKEGEANAKVFDNISVIFVAT